MLLEKIQLEADEQVLAQVRRHWFVITISILSLVIAAVLPLPLLLLLESFVSSNFTLPFSVSNHWAEILFLQSLWCLMIWFGIFNVWTNYYLDVLTITDRRAILINQRGFFRRAVTSFRLERLQDMNIEINGIIATLLDFGDVHAETAGHGEEEFRATSLPKPRELKGLILKAADKRLPSNGHHDEL